MARHQAGQWLQTIAPNLREVIGSWKSTGTSDPQAAGDAFLGAVAKLSATTATADEKAKALVRETIVAEIPAFLEARGPAALDAVLRQLAISPTPLPITVSDVDLALTPQQKGALVRHWMAATP